MHLKQSYTEDINGKEKSETGEPERNYGHGDMGKM